MTDRVKILFLCTGNSCRSQMAEGFVNALKKEKYEAYSAGTHPAEEISSLAVKAMNEVGIDISKQKPKGIEQLKGIRFDYVVTLCEDAKENCPYFPAKVKVIHKGFQDPMPSNDLAVYRKVRDQIKDFIESITI